MITQVTTTPAGTADETMVEPIHATLAEAELLPAEHLMDTGFVRIEHVVESPKRHGVRVIGPVARDSSWQAHIPNGFDQTHFRIDWERQVVTCPMGKESGLWYAEDPGKVRQAQVCFKREDCEVCVARAQCTRSKQGRRVLSLQPRPYLEALQELRQYQKTQAFKALDDARSGVECLFSQGSRRCDVQQARYRGQRKMQVQQLRSRDGDQSLAVGCVEAGTTYCPHASFPFLRPLGCLTLPTVSGTDLVIATDEFQVRSLPELDFVHFQLKNRRSKTTTQE